MISEWVAQRNGNILRKLYIVHHVVAGSIKTQNRHNCVSQKNQKELQLVLIFL